MHMSRILLATLLLSTAVQASQLKNVTYTPGTEVEANDSLAIEVTFLQEKGGYSNSSPLAVISAGSDELKPVKCGVLVNWGDGTEEKVRLGKDVEPPFRFTHAYKGTGQYALKITGKTIFRGLNSVMGCKADYSKTISVIDSGRAERELAAKKKRAEQEKREAKKLAAQSKYAAEKQRKRQIEAKKAAEERNALLAIQHEKEKEAEEDRQAALQLEQELERQAEAERTARLALAQKRKQAHYDADLKRLADGSEPIVWAEKPVETAQKMQPAPMRLAEVNGRLWEITNTSMTAARKPRPVKPTYRPPVVRQKGEFEKTADYKKFVQKENGEHTTAYNAKLAAYEKEITAYDRERAELRNRKGAIYARHAKQILPAWLGAMDKAIRYDADKEHYVLSIASRQYPEYRVTAVLPVSIDVAKSKNDQIRNAPVKVIFSIANGSLEAKGIVVSTDKDDFSGSAASTTSVKLTEDEARQQQKQLASIAQAETEKRLQAERAKRKEAERLAALEAKKKTEAEEKARKEAEHLAAIEAERLAKENSKRNALRKAKHNAQENNSGADWKECVIKGNSVKKNAARCKKQADEGNPIAQHALAWMYEKGKGVPQSDSMAFAWYSKAAEQGHPNAQNNLAWMYEHGKGVGLNYTLAFDWYKKAAEQDYSRSQNKLGEMYEKGEGTQIDYKQSARWYQLAIANGHIRAKDNFSAISEKLRALGKPAPPPMTTKVITRTNHLNRAATIRKETNESLLNKFEVIAAEKPTTKGIFYFGHSESSATGIPFLADHSTSPWGVVCNDYDKQDDGELRGILKIKDNMYYVKNAKSYKVYESSKSLDTKLRNFYFYPIRRDRSKESPSKYQGYRTKDYYYSTHEGEQKFTLNIKSNTYLEKKVKHHQVFTFNRGKGLEKAYSRVHLDITERNRKFGRAWFSHCFTIPPDWLARNEVGIKIAAAKEQVDIENRIAEAAEIEERKKAKRKRIAEENKRYRLAQERKALELATNECITGDDGENRFSNCMIAANKGNALAQDLVADMYVKGNGVARDYGKAAHWYETLAAQGNTSATKSLSIVNELIRLERRKAELRKQQIAREAEEKRKQEEESTWYALSNFLGLGEYTCNKKDNGKTPADLINRHRKLGIPHKVEDFQENGIIVKVEIKLTSKGMKNVYYRGRSRCEYDAGVLNASAKQSNDRITNKYR